MCPKPVQKSENREMNAAVCPSSHGHYMIMRRRGMRMTISNKLYIGMGVLAEAFKGLTIYSQENFKKRRWKLRR
jgi:hypothetical protein